MNKECSCDGGRLIGVRENDVDDDAVGGVPTGVIEDIVDIFEKGTKTGVGGEYLYNMLILNEAWLDYKMGEQWSKKGERKKKKEGKNKKGLTKGFKDKEKIHCHCQVFESLGAECIVIGL